MIKVLCVLVSLAILALSLAAAVALIFYAYDRLTDYFRRYFTRKYRLDQVDIDLKWWYELIDDHLVVSKQIIRWYYRWYINPDGIYSISPAGVPAACNDAINQCLDIIHQLYTLEHEILWRRYHYGRCDLNNAEDWADSITRDRRRMEFYLKDLKQKEILMLAKMTAKAAENPPSEDDEYFILR